MIIDSVLMVILDRIVILVGIVNQCYMICNDSRLGGIVGLMLSSVMGCKVVDVGILQLSMYSICVIIGSLDFGFGFKFYKGFLDNWEKVDKEWCFQIFFVMDMSVMREENMYE